MPSSQKPITIFFEHSSNRSCFISQETENFLTKPSGVRLIKDGEFPLCESLYPLS